MRRAAVITLILTSAIFAYLTRTSPPIIAAHRAGAELMPENTLEGWKTVRELFQPDVFELDVRLTADDSVVVIHDEVVDRTTDGIGLVRFLPFEEIRQMDAACWFTPDSGRTYPLRAKGVHIPTLSEVFDSFPRDNFNIEIKDSLSRAAELLVALIRKRGMEDQVVIASVYTPVIQHVREIAPEIATSGSEEEVRSFVLLGKVGLGFLAKTHMNILQVPESSGSIRVVTRGLIRRSHKRGILVHVWTVNDAASMERLLKLGVDGIITDRPDLAIEVFKRLDLREVVEP